MVIKRDLSLNVNLYDLSDGFPSYCNLYQNCLVIKADLGVPLDDLCDAFSSYNLHQNCMMIKPDLNLNVHLYDISDAFSS